MVMETDTSENRPVGQPEVGQKDGEAIELPQPAPSAEAEAPQGDKQEGRVFTEAEVRDREAAITAKLDKEVASHKAALEKTRVDQMIGAMVNKENQARAKDQREVDEGSITQEEAGQRQTLRNETARVYFERQQLEQDKAEVNQYLMAAGRHAFVSDVAKEFGVDAEALLTDSSLTDREKVLRKAFHLSQAKRKAQETKPEVWDRGPSGSTGKRIAPITDPSELIAQGLREQRKKTK